MKQAILFVVAAAITAGFYSAPVCGQVKPAAVKPAPPATQPAPPAKPQTPLEKAITISGEAPLDMPKAIQVLNRTNLMLMSDSVMKQSRAGLKISGILTLQCNVPDVVIQPCDISGVRFATAAGRLPRATGTRRDPLVVVINIGVDEVAAGLGKELDPATVETYKTNLAKLVDAARAAGGKVILLSPTILDENPESEGNGRLAKYVEAMRKLAAAKNCIYVDLHRMFLEALKHKPEGMKERFLTNDGGQLNDLGTAVMTLGLARALGISDDKITATGKP